MKKHIQIITLFCIGMITGRVDAQSLEAGYGHFGAMVYYHGPIPQADVEIRRTPSGKEMHDQEWKLRPSKSASEFLERAKSIPPVFSGLIPFTEKSASYYIEKIASTSSLASVPMAQAPNVLFAMGFAVWDTLVMPGQSYTYQIFSGNKPLGDKIILRAELKEQHDWTPAFYNATHDERIIRCRWKIPYNRKDEVYSYIAYRTSPFQPEYKIAKGISSFIVAADTILAVFMDTSSSTLPGTYQYMIRTVNRFGLLGPVSEYALGSNFPPEAEPVMVYFKATGAQDQPAIQLNWRLLNPWRIRSMKLYRSRSYDGPYEVIGHFSAADSTYLDQVTDVMESYFYYFEMEDIAHTEVLTTAKVTSVSDYQWPAEIPDSVSAEVQQKNITIRWKRAGFQDRGYYVLRTQGFGTPETIVSEMIPVKEEKQWYEWTDTSSLLTPDHTFTYAVISESIGYEKSPISETVEGRPEIPLYMPAPGELKLNRLTDSTYLLRWSDLSQDVSLHHLGYRVFVKDEKANSGHRPLHDALLIFENNYFEMTNVHPEDTFVVKAYNIHGDESVYSEPVSLQDPFYYRFGPEYLMGKNEESGIRVEWNSPLHAGIQGYALYRIGADQIMNKIAQPKATDVNFLDTKVKSGETYYYFITAVTDEKMESEASEMLNITR